MLSIAEVELEPGDATTPQRLPGIEGVHHTVSGASEDTVVGVVTATSAGSCVRIPPGAEHRVRTVGTTALRLLGVTTPPVAAPVRPAGDA